MLVERSRTGRREPVMTELEMFLDQMLPSQIAAERAIHDGDVEPRLALWSRDDPVSLFGAVVPCETGWQDLERTFGVVASWFSDCTSYDFELVAAGVSGDLAYTVGFEHTSASVEGVPRTYSLRVTHVYRRENGAWRIVHRHGDSPPEDFRGTTGAARDALSTN
jgi:ketosteroid isomerase-like protein